MSHTVYNVLLVTETGLPCSFQCFGGFDRAQREHYNSTDEAMRRIDDAIVQGLNGGSVIGRFIAGFVSHDRTAQPIPVHLFEPMEREARKQEIADLLDIEVSDAE